MIQIDELNAAIKGALDEYNAEVNAEIKNLTEKSMKDLVKRTKTTAPVGRRRKHYRDNISSRTLEKGQTKLVKQWYVKGSDYRLTHLLNNGHALRGGGRYPGTNFLGNAVDAIVPEYVSQLEEVLKNG